MGSENKLQRQKMGPGSLGARKAKVTCLGERGVKERQRRAPERKSGHWVLVLRILKVRG